MPCVFQFIMSQVNKNTAEPVPYLEHVKISYFKLSAVASRSPSAHRELLTSFCSRRLGVNAACAQGCMNLITDHGVTVLIISPSLENEVYFSMLCFPNWKTNWPNLSLQIFTQWTIEVLHSSKSRSTCFEMSQQIRKLKCHAWVLCLCVFFPVFKSHCDPRVFAGVGFPRT